MKKYLLSFVVALMATITFTACGDDDNNDVNDISLAKTAWQGKIVNEEQNFDVTVNFDTNESGMLYGKGTMMVEEDMVLPTEMYAQFSYTLTDGKGLAKVVKMCTIIETPMGKIPQEMTGENLEEAALPFEYDAKSNKLTIADEEGIVSVLSKGKYNEIKYPVLK